MSGKSLLRLHPLKIRLNAGEDLPRLARAELLVEPFDRVTVVLGIVTVATRRHYVLRNITGIVGTLIGDWYKVILMEPHVPKQSRRVPAIGTASREISERPIPIFNREIIGKTFLSRFTSLLLNTDFMHVFFLIALRALANPIRIFMPIAITTRSSTFSKLLRVFLFGLLFIDFSARDYLFTVALIIFVMVLRVGLRRMLLSVILLIFAVCGIFSPFAPCILSFSFKDFFSGEVNMRRRFMRVMVTRSAIPTASLAFGSKPAVLALIKELRCGQIAGTALRAALERVGDIQHGMFTSYHSPCWAVAGGGETHFSGATLATKSYYTTERG